MKEKGNRLLGHLTQHYVNADGYVHKVSRQRLGVGLHTDTHY